MTSIELIFDPRIYKINIEKYWRCIEPYQRIKSDIHMRSLSTLKMINGELIFFPLISESEQKLLDQCDEIIDYYFTKFNKGYEIC